MLAGLGQAHDHRVERFGEFAHEVHALLEVSPGDHLGLPGQVAEVGLKSLEGAGGHPFGRECLCQVAFGNAERELLHGVEVGEQLREPALLVRAAGRLRGGNGASIPGSLQEPQRLFKLVVHRSYARRGIWKRTDPQDFTPLRCRCAWP